jgi:hypothetical protein
MLVKGVHFHTAVALSSSLVEVGHMAQWPTDVHEAYDLCVGARVPALVRPADKLRRAGFREGQLSEIGGGTETLGPDGLSPALGR